MLTPMDIQQKRFHVGIGFDKKDVTTFFESVAESYEQLYRSNAELKEQVASLEDMLQNYRSKEASLEKSIMLAEKDSEDKKSKASKEAKSIELDAKNRAKIIIGDAEERLKEVEAQIEMLKTQYASYKSSLASLLKMHLTHLKEEDFDADSYIDPRFAGMFMGGGAPAAASGGGSGSFAYNGDPQMRDESTLGGASGGYGMSMNPDAKATSSEVYTSLMKDNENFVDPFNTDKVANGRYNPYDGRTEKKEKKTGQVTFTVASPNKNRNRAKTSNTNQSQNNQRNKTYAGGTKTDNAATPKTETKAQSPSAEELRKKKEEEILAELKAMRMAAEKAKAEEEAKKAEAADSVKPEEKAEAADSVKPGEKAETTEAVKPEEKAGTTEDIDSVNPEEKAETADAENNVADETTTAEEENNVAKEKAKEFFKKAANQNADEDEAVEVTEEEFVGEVEDSDKVGGKLLIGDDDSDSEEEFEFF